MKLELINLNEKSQNQNETKEEKEIQLKNSDSEYNDENTNDSTTPKQRKSVECSATDFFNNKESMFSYQIKKNENCHSQISQKSSPNQNQVNRFSLLDSTVSKSEDNPDSIPDYMSFTYLDILALMFSICTFIFDFVTDVVVTVFHYMNEDYWYFSLTIIFVAIPALIMTIMSLRWYILDSKDPSSLKVSKTQWLFRMIFLTFQLGPIMRYIDAILYGFKFRKLNEENKKVARRYFQYMIYEDTDATMLRLFECFMEAAPQLVLQMSIMIIKVPDKKKDWTILVQALSVLASLISLSWSPVSYLRNLRMSLPHKQNMTWTGTMIQFLWRFFMITSRVLALALFASEFTYYISIVCSIHWLIMFLWIVNMKTSFCHNKFEELIYNAILGVIFIFCYFNPVDSPSRKRYVFYYSVIFIENIIILLFWYHVCNPSRWYRLPALIVYFLSFFLALVFMIIYYLKLHPTQNIHIFKTSSGQECTSSRNHTAETVTTNEPSSSTGAKVDKEQKFKSKTSKNYKRQFSDVWTTNGRFLHPRPAVPTV